MSEVRCAVTYHCKIDPAKQTIGLASLPAEITRTISCGDSIKTEKVALAVLPLADREQLEALVAQQVVEAVRVAQPTAAKPAAPACAAAVPAAPAPAPAACVEDEEEGMDLFA